MKSAKDVMDHNLQHVNRGRRNIRFVWGDRKGNRSLLLWLFSAFTTFSQMALAASVGVHILDNGVVRYNNQTSVTGRSTNGDTYRCTQSIPALSGDVICTYNDGYGSDPGDQNRNVGVLRLHFDRTNPNNNKATAIDTLSELGVKVQKNTNGWTDGLTWKSGGIYYEPKTNLTYLYIHRQCDSPNPCTVSGYGTIPRWASMQGSILVSPDIHTGTATPHWCNPATIATHGSCAAPWWDNGGDAPSGPTPTASTLFPGLNHAGKLEFVQFNAGDTTDNSGTYGYALSAAGDWSGTYLYRFPWASVQKVSTWEYYKGPVGGEYLSNANWCSGTESACEPNQTNVGLSPGLPVMAHLPAPWNSYLVAGTNSNDVIEVLSASGITGPYTLISTYPAPVQQGFPSLLMGSLMDADPADKNGIGEVALISSGQYTDSASDYSMYFTYLILGTPSASFSLPARTIPGTINASDYDYGLPGTAFYNPSPYGIYSKYRPYEGVDISTCSDGPNCLYVGWMSPEEWIDYTVTPAKAGNYYSVTARVASATSGASFHLEINGKTVAGPFDVPDTGGWDSWTSVTVPLNYSMPGSGSVKVEFVVDRAGFNLQSLQFEKSHNGSRPIRRRSSPRAFRRSPRT